MAKHLCIETMNDNWRLPAETDMDNLNQRISNAFAKGLPLEVPVELGDDPRARTVLTINTARVKWIAAIETPEESG
jgi:hypothetical protein